MPDRFFRSWATGVRGAALAAVAVLGLVCIVGSGGGALVPSDCPAGVDCSTPSPQPVLTPQAAVQPAAVTVLVGSPVVFTAVTTQVTGTPSYQWSRSTDGGASYADIAGATAASYQLAAANLADEGTRYLVTVRANNGEARAEGRLAVSATPGLVFADSEFLAADWLVSPISDSAGSAPAHAEEQVATGGNPGSWRRMTYQLPGPRTSGIVVYSALAAVFQPQLQGAVHVIDYAEDCIALPAAQANSTQSGVLLEQDGRRYVATSAAAGCGTGSWSPGQGRAGLGARNFLQLDGPACAAGVACPDFSALGAPMRFGYWRQSFGLPSTPIVHGIDNWKVTVWTR